MAKAQRRPTERSLHLKLERACHALVRSARQTVRLDRPWPNKSEVPRKKLWSVADLLNQLGRIQ